MSKNPPTLKVRPTKPQWDILTSNSKLNLFLAGQGSGKSHTAGFLSYHFVSNFPTAYGFIGANTDMQLTDSTLNRILKVWREEFRIEEYDDKTGQGQYIIDKKPPEHFNTSGHDFRHYRNKISFINGCVIFIGSLENYKAHDGKEFAWAILDETKDTKEEAVKEVILGRLRQPGLKNNKGEDWNPLFILTSPAKVQWINEWFQLEDYEPEILGKIHDKEDYFSKVIDNKFVVISSTFHNQRNLPSNYISEMLSNLPTELQEMLVYGNPFSKAGGEFYKGFDRSTHIRSIPYDPDRPLHITFDFNVNPYMTMCVWQFHKSDLIIGCQIDEVCLPSPKNSTQATCDEFIKRYPNHSAGLFVYGDPSGKNKDTRSETDKNDFTIIREKLRKYRPKLKIPRKAANVSLRGDFINAIFEKNFRSIYLFIAKQCKNTITDYTFLKEDSKGGKYKEKVKNKDTKVTYEKYGHTSDANDYLICEYFKAELKLFKKGINQ